MKKIITFAAVFAFLFSSWPEIASAQVEFEKVKSRTEEKLKVTGFFDYYPFGRFEKSTYYGVFKPFISEFADEGRYNLDWLPISMSYEDTIR